VDVAEVDREVTVTLAGVSEQLSPVGAGAERLMVPLKPPRLRTVIVEEPASPALTGTKVGPALTEKSAASVMTTLAARDKDPLVPVTVTVRGF